MIRRYAQVFAVVLLVTGAGSVSAAGNKQSTAPDIQTVVESYFQSLQAGDRQTLLSLFAGEEREHLDSQTSDPSYVQFLVDRYRGARLEIGDSGAEGLNKFVDVTIWLSNGEAVSERLVLETTNDRGQRAYYIVAREVLNK